MTAVTGGGGLYVQGPWVGISPAIAQLQAQFTDADFQAANLLTTGFVRLGTAGTAAPAGVVRLQDVFAINARDGGAQSVGVLSKDAADLLTVGGLADIRPFQIFIDATNSIFLQIAGSTRCTVTTTAFKIKVADALFDNNVLAPTWRQETDAVAAVVGDRFLTHAQDVSGDTDPAGGAKAIRSGGEDPGGAVSANVSSGDLELYCGAVKGAGTRGNAYLGIDAAGTVANRAGNVTVDGQNFVDCSIAGTLHTRIQFGAFSWNIATVQFFASILTPSILQGPDAGAAAVGDLFTRASQDVSGAGATVGGAALSRAGDATGPGPNTGGDYTARPGAGTVGGTYAIANGAGADVVHANDAGWHTDDAVHHNRTTVNFGMAPYAVVATDHVLGVTTAGGAVPIDLPPAASHADRHLLIKDEGGVAGAANITVNGNAAETIDGALTAVLLANFAAINIYCDGSNWFIY
jgi:hypothetical protein